MTAGYAALAVYFVAAFTVATPGTRDLIPPILDDFANSAAAAYGTLTVNVDITENDAPTLPGEASVYYSTDAQATWTQVALAEVLGAAGGTWEGAFPVAGGDVFYYVIAHDDSAAAMSAPVNAANAFPPAANLLANPGDEPAGDAYVPNTQALDLTGTALGYSDSYLYATLSNVTGSWPLSGGILGPWYLYTVVIDNPDAGSNSSVLALVYCNVPVLATTGLYLVDASDTTYVRVGDIGYAVQGGKLHLRAALSDLYAQPAFGSFNPSGFWHCGAGTATATLAGEQFENDMTNLYAFYHRTEVAEVGTNETPWLSNGGWELGEAGGREIPVRFRVTYGDPDGHLAVARTVVVDGEAHEMVSATPVHDYAAGVEFEYETALVPGEHVFHFEFSDGLAAIETAPESALVPSGVPGEPRVVALAFASPQGLSEGLDMICSLGGAQSGSLRFHDATGKLVREIAVTEGTVRWNGRGQSGERVASGVYFVELSCAAGTDRAKAVIMR